MNDPLNFCKADDFYKEAPSWGGPTKVTSISETPPSDAKVSSSWHGVTLKFDDNTLCVIQFVRPTLWRVRYDPAVKDANEYTDVNSRTIVMDHMSELTAALDGYIGLTWVTKLKASDDGSYWTFSSEVTKSEPQFGRPSFYKAGDGMKLVLYKDRFRIQALRSLTPLSELYPMPKEYGTAATTPKEKIVWQTSLKTFRHHTHEKHTMLKDVVLDIVKAGHGEYVGFGEQGGTSFMKKACFMNYFNSDNMQYQQVYNQGPLDAREPLYHSDPFYLDVNSNPEHANVTATFLDNYSQISVDFGKTNAGYIKLGTRFNAMDCYLISADTVPQIVRLYTSLMGRPRLKPRYILGHHQACYGYDSDDSIRAVYTQYRASRIPIDGLHIDVDFQNKFRTFTIDPGFFGKYKEKVWPGPREMFNTLRENGFKCSTNITPVISITPHDPSYKTYHEGIEKDYFVKDERYLDNPNDSASNVQYICYNGGRKEPMDPKDVNRRPEIAGVKDPYPFEQVWNSGQPFHGGVSYGYSSGTPGHYPDLNRKEVRIWWGKQYEYLFDQGLEFVWQDMTTPAIADAYGDMKGFPSRLLVSSDHNGLSRQVGNTTEQKKLAIELWALYSYNLHKATANGLDHLHELVPSRAGKRNFILGRGSYAGMYRYAGLWTGDNASTWDFWRITVSQVLSVGLNGVSVAGSDTGGFEPGKKKENPNEEEPFCQPELLIRWYAGSFLLPWLRNHYVRKTRKWFQEPYAYPRHATDSGMSQSDRQIFDAVEGICRYYVELRYCLIQLLYDAMFENVLDGLPIARSMLLTDTQDTSFYNESQEFLDNQYIVRRDILVAPIMKSKSENWGENRDVYLPLGYFWYPFNLRPGDKDGNGQGVGLGPAAEGGSVINYVAEIQNNPDKFPYVTPVYIREGGIIPQLKVTQYVGDITDGPNHIKFNIYPGKDRVGEDSYITYLDDGVSRNSAPNDLVYDEASASDTPIPPGDERSKYLDKEAENKYRAVSVSQQTSANSTRTVTIKLEKEGYDPVKELGSTYSIILWYPQGTKVDTYEVKVNGNSNNTVTKDNNLGMIKVIINETIGTTKSIAIEVVPK